MPSSLIWVAIVVGWIVVLFPMAAGKRSPVSRTGDATLQTRVLHRGGTRRTVRGPAAGHLSDPEYQPTAEQERARRGEGRALVAELVDDDTATEVAIEAHADQIDALDVETVVEYDEDLADEDFFAEDRDDTDTHADTDTHTDGDVAAEYDDHDDDYDQGGADEAMDIDERTEIDDDGPIVATVPEVPAVEELPRTGRGGYDPEADMAARMGRYRTRQRTVIGLAAGAVITLVLAVLISSAIWWVTAALVVALAGYLTYLRRQVRLEEQIRSRRMSRLIAVRKQADADRREHVHPSRAHRYGAVVLEADDEDPDFVHLDHPDHGYTHGADPHDDRAAV